MLLSKLKPNPSAVVELLPHAPGLFITVASRDSAPVKAAMDAITEKRLAAASRGTRKAPTLEDIEAERMQVLTAAVLGIDDQTGDGEPMQFTPETVAELLAIEWVQRVIDKAMGDDALFFEN